MWRLCQLLQARGQTASRQRSEAAKWSPVRDAPVYCWPNNGPRLAGRIQHGCHVCGDRQQRLASVGLIHCLLARLGNGGLSSYLLFGSGAFHSGKETWR